MTTDWEGHVAGGPATPVHIIGAQDSIHVPVSENWRAAGIDSYTNNDSYKTLDVPAGQEWQIFAIHAHLVTTATVGNRQMLLTIYQDSGITMVFGPQFTQAASLTNDYYFAPGLPEDSSIITAIAGFRFARIPIPLLTLEPGAHIEIGDNNAIAAAADDMWYGISYAKRSV